MPYSHRILSRRLAGVLLSYLLALVALPAASSRAQEQFPQVPNIPPGSAYRQTNFVSDVPGVAFIQDPFLVNPWGISMTSTSPFWIANTGTSTSSLYRGDVGGSPVVPQAGLPRITIPGGVPTGTVAAPGVDFTVVSGTASGPARFIFASLSGNITAWNPNVPAPGSTQAVIMRSMPGHVWTGLAIATISTGTYLYAADVAQGHIDVFDAGFNPTSVSGNFTDPGLPAGYRPYNVQAFGTEIWVTYTQIDPVTQRELNAPGNGIVNVFNADGGFLRRFATGGALNAPWGLAQAPASFGLFSNAMLVGNFRDGRINAYNRTTGAFLGTLQDEAGQPIVNEGLWAITFGNGGNGGDPNTLYLAAGIANENHGLFASIKPTTATATSLIQFGADDFAINEMSGHIDITVTRSGDASGTATVNYATFDETAAGQSPPPAPQPTPAPGHATQKADYEIALGKLTFNPGETSKTFRVLLVDDSRAEGNEAVRLVLSNPTGAGLGAADDVDLTIIDNDVSTSTSNPIDQSSFFVRQHYLDFLNREPDASGLNFWTNVIESCGADAQCREVNRINVSAAFFLSIEFQRTGVLAYLSHRAAFGPTAPGSPAPVLYGQFMRDTQQLQRNLVFGQPNFEAQLEANKQEYFADFVQRPEFVARFGGMTNAQYVDALLTSAGIDPANQRLFVVQMTNAQENPPVTNPTTTTGAPRPASFGTARFQFNQAFTALSMTATVNNIDFTGSQTADTNDNLTNAHIHASATLTPTTNAGVVWGFIGTPFNDNNPNDSRVTPFASGVGANVSAKWDAPEGNNTTLAAQLDNLRNGRAYVNFHTSQFPGGEIRGNFPASTAFRDSLVNGLNGATMTRADVLRRIAESEEFTNNEFNRIFVTMEYFGYLRRDPDPGGFNFWLNQLNAFNGNFIQAELVKAFITSAEYRQRFGSN
jgi:uncharacterized protein (TIGR03118 family)